MMHGQTNIKSVVVVLMGPYSNILEEYVRHKLIGGCALYICVIIFSQFVPYTSVCTYGILFVKCRFGDM